MLHPVSSAKSFTMCAAQHAHLCLSTQRSHGQRPWRACCCALKVLRPPHRSFKIAQVWMPVNVIFVGMIWTSFFALKNLGVPMATVLKNLTNLFTIGGDYMLYGKVGCPACDQGRNASCQVDNAEHVGRRQMLCAMPLIESQAETLAGFAHYTIAMYGVPSQVEEAAAWRLKRQ